jgi:hypothetical protein
MYVSKFSVFTNKIFQSFDVNNTNDKYLNIIISEKLEVFFSYSFIIQIY